jgi:hypothetical protein
VAEVNNRACSSSLVEGLDRRLQRLMEASGDYYWLEALGSQTLHLTSRGEAHQPQGRERVKALTTCRDHHLLKLR